jgi:AraC-like DNA-binding protein
VSLFKKGCSVAEIAYEVGFNNPKNLPKFFKEEFKKKKLKSLHIGE